ncbi:MAG: hypothetical protein SPG14_01310, partial [Lactobacillus amylovorus]|nr:hypothetical protein [Lactobacillus amylovorus]
LRSLSAESTRKSAPTSLLAGALCFGRVFCDAATGYQGRGRSSLLCFCVAVTGLLKTFKADGKIDGVVFPVNA